MKKLSFLFVSLLFLSACNSAAPVQIQPVTTPVQSVTSNSTMTIAGLELSLPEGWVAGENSVGKKGHNLVSIKVPDSKYNVSLKMDFFEGGPNDGTYNDDKLLEATSADTGNSVYTNTCGGAFECVALYLKGDTNNYYLVNVEVQSDEPVPTNLDGVWSPKVEVAQGEIAKFLLSAQKL